MVTLTTTAVNNKNCMCKTIYHLTYVAVPFTLVGSVLIYSYFKKIFSYFKMLFKGKRKSIIYPQIANAQ